MLINFHPKLGRHQFYKKTWWSILESSADDCQKGCRRAFLSLLAWEWISQVCRKAPPISTARGMRVHVLLISIFLLKGRILVVFHYFYHSFGENSRNLVPSPFDNPGTVVREPGEMVSWWCSVGDLLMQPLVGVTAALWSYFFQINWDAQSNHLTLFEDVEDNKHKINLITDAFTST